MNKITIPSEPHPIFTMSEDRGLFLPNNNQHQLHLFQLHSLRREPANLRCHVQYIFSLIRQEDVPQETVFAALADLFIILNNKGDALRVRMLKAATPFLSANLISFFQQHLESGLHARTPLPISCPSILTEAYTGKADHIKKNDNNAARTEKSTGYDYALELINQGDLISAAQLLEDLLYKTPDNEQIAEDLAAVLRHTEQEHKLSQIQDWFMQNNLPLPNCWPLF